MPKASKARALANKERQVNAARMNRMGRALTLSLATLLSFATVSLLLVDRLYRPDTFVIDQLKIKGKLRHLQPQEIESRVQKIGVGNFFSIELDRIKAEVESLAWVQSANVRREWPNSLLIEVQEHRPVMRWNKNQWLNSYGDIVDLELSDAEQFDFAPRAIQLKGPDHDSALMLRKAYTWKRRLAANGLTLRSLELSGSHAWTLSLEQMQAASDFKVLLGREDVEQRLARFLFLYETHFQLSDQRLQRVDARYPDGVAIKSETIETDEALAMQSDLLSAVQPSPQVVN